MNHVIQILAVFGCLGAEDVLWVGWMSLRGSPAGVAASAPEIPALPKEGPRPKSAGRFVPSPIPSRFTGVAPVDPAPVPPVESPRPSPQSPQVNVVPPRSVDAAADSPRPRRPQPPRGQDDPTPVVELAAGPKLVSALPRAAAIQAPSPVPVYVATPAAGVPVYVSSPVFATPCASGFCPNPAISFRFIGR